MGKSQSLMLLDSLGLNTVDFFITSNKKEAERYLFRNGLKKSLRTERGEEFLCPYYYSKEPKELIESTFKHIDEGYTLILYDAIDANDALMFGALALTREEDHLDFVIGPGKLRELDTHPNKLSYNIPIGTIRPFFATGVERQLTDLYNTIKCSCSEYSPCVVEWSLYPYLVGSRKQNIVYWELRSYD